MGCTSSCSGFLCKGKLNTAKKFIYQMRGLYSKSDIILKKTMVIGFTENVKIVGLNNDINHFDTCGLSIFLQIHFLYNILLVLLRPKTDIFPQID